MWVENGLEMGFVLKNAYTIRNTLDRTHTLHSLFYITKVIDKQYRFVHSGEHAQAL